MKKKLKTERDISRYSIGMLVSGVVIGLAWMFQHSTQSFAVSAPTIDMVTAAQTSGGSETSFNLTENNVSTLFVHGTVTDLDGCEDVAVNGTVTAKFYRTNHPSGEGCSADNNDCYVLDNTSCVKTGCSGPGDNTFNYECTAAIQFYADSTTQGPQAASDWTAKVTAKDQADTAGTLTDTIEMNTLLALNVPASVNYGTIPVDTIGSGQSLTITNTGNGGIDSKFQVNGSMICDGQGSINIPPGNVHYSGTSGFSWVDGIGLSTTLTEFELNLGPRTNDASPMTKNMFFRLKMPTSGVRGMCSNVLSVVAAGDAENGW